MNITYFGSFPSCCQRKISDSLMDTHSVTNALYLIYFLHNLQTLSFSLVLVSANFGKDYVNRLDSTFPVLILGSAKWAHPIWILKKKILGKLEKQTSIQIHHCHRCYLCIQKIIKSECRPVTTLVNLKHKQNIHFWQVGVMAV